MIAVARGTHRPSTPGRRRRDQGVDGGRRSVVNITLGSHGRDRLTGGCPACRRPMTRRRSMRTPASPHLQDSDGGHRWRLRPGSRARCLDSALTLDLVPRRPSTPLPLAASTGTDGALRWHAINSGLSLTTVSSVAVDLQRPQIVYASTGPFGLFRSRDGGVLVARRGSTQEGRRRRYRPARAAKMILALARLRGVRRRTPAARQPAGAGLPQRGVSVLAISGGGAAQRRAVCSAR